MRDGDRGVNTRHLTRVQPLTGAAVVADHGVRTIVLKGRQVLSWFRAFVVIERIDR
jgi:hypothetical protein